MGWLDIGGHGARLESMPGYVKKTYQGPGALEQAVIDLVRVGGSGHAAGVRQLANRLVRSVPETVGDAEAFRQQLREAMHRTNAEPTLRFAGGEVPTDDGGHHRLVEVEAVPESGPLIWPPGQMTALRDVIEERAQADALRRSGLGLTRTILLSGPPGVGKTMAAAWLASEVGLPLVSLDLAAVVSSFLGSSGRNIRSVLDYGKSGPCVLLLDEFDALAKRREDDTDIGELKRIVNVILVELDRWPDTSLLVAATNHPQLLDPAVHRRFDLHIDVPMPGPDERIAILSWLSGDGFVAVTPAQLELIAALTDGMSGSDLVRLWRAAARRVLLTGGEFLQQALAQLELPKLPPGPQRDQTWSLLAEVGGLSAREIAARAGSTHPTVSKAIKRLRESA